MTIRNLAGTLRPASVAVIGASIREGSVGRVVIENALAGGFSGDVYPVNPKYQEVAGQRCYARVADLPKPPDLAVIATPAATVPGIVAELGECGVPVAVVLAAGFDQDGLRQKLLDAARPRMVRIIGPNTIGLLAPQVRLNASFVHISPEPGRLGLISQSGAMVSSIIDWAVAENIGFSQIFSLGDMSDVDAADCLNLLAEDARTAAILLYLESIPAPRKFMSAARAAARLKPVIAVKPGRHAQAAAAARTHTGALSGSDRVVEAALRRAGIIRVNDLEDLFSAAEITARFHPLRRGRTAIVTNGGGAGVLAVDHLIDRDCELAELQPETRAALDAVLPPTWSHANPVDIIGDAPPERYASAVSVVARDPGVDALLVMNCPTGLSSSSGAATAVAALVEDGLVNGKPVLACWLGKATAEPARALLQASGIASVDTPEAAAEAVALLTRWSALRQLVERVPANTVQFRIDRLAVARILRTVADEGRSLLTETEAKAVVGGYGIPVPEIAVAGDPAEVEAAAARLLVDHRAVVVKLLSRAISHKSDVGGVVLDIRSAADAGAAARAIRARLEKLGTQHQIDGFSVQPMIRRPGAEELIIGLNVDPIFGPTVLFGAGGVAVEVLKDTAIGLVPLDEVLAGDLIDQTRISRLLAGYRDVLPANRLAIEQALIGLSQLAIDFPCVVGADINPLLADNDGVIALDARVEIDPARIDEKGPSKCLAIRPYPSGWEMRAKVGERSFLIRPMRPVDIDLYPAFTERMDPEDMRLRFLMPTHQIPHDMLINFTQLDYDREIAFVALEEPGGAMAAVVRYSADPDHERAEFGIIVRSDLKGLGLGKILLGRLIAYARVEGIKRLDGLILRENSGMLHLATRFGFKPDHEPPESSLVRTSLDLTLDHEPVA